MSIVYIGLAIEKKLLISYTPINMNYLGMVLKIINQLDEDKEYKSSEKYKENSIIYYIHSNHITYICIDFFQVGDSNSFNFLLDIQKEFQKIFPKFDILNYDSSYITETFKSTMIMMLDDFINTDYDNNKNDKNNSEQKAVC